MLEFDVLTGDESISTVISNAAGRVEGRQKPVIYSTGGRNDGFGEFALGAGKVAGALDALAKCVRRA